MLGTTHDIAQPHRGLCAPSPSGRHMGDNQLNDLELPLCRTSLPRPRSVRRHGSVRSSRVTYDSAYQRRPCQTAASLTCQLVVTEVEDLQLPEYAQLPRDVACMQTFEEWQTRESIYQQTRHHDDGVMHPKKRPTDSF